MVVYNGIVSDKIREILGEFKDDAIVNNSETMIMRVTWQIMLRIVSFDS